MTTNRDQQGPSATDVLKKELEAKAPAIAAVLADAEYGEPWVTCASCGRMWDPATFNRCQFCGDYAPAE